MNASLISGSSDNPNILSIQKVRMNSNYCRVHSSYNPDMARKRENVTVVGPDWFLVDWMRSLHVTQAKLGRETGWSKATVNDIFHGKTSYYRQIVNEAARALNIAPWELLMHPARSEEQTYELQSLMRISYAVF